MKFRVVDQRTIFRPSRGPQAFYGKVIKTGASEYLCSVIMSSKIEALDSHTEILRSTDGGRTWINEGPVIRDEAERKKYTEIGFIGSLPSGSLFYTAARWSNSGRQKGRPLVNAKTVGMKDNEILLRTTEDNGRTWSKPVAIPKTLDVPVEAPSSPFVLGDGTIILPFASWKKWDGSCPYGHSIYALKSDAKLRKWSGPFRVIRDNTGKTGFWESRIAALTRTTLIATCWAHDWESDADMENHFALSRDGGVTWIGPFAGRTRGQTGFPLAITENLILFVYNHRRDPVGVRGQIALIDGKGWRTLCDGMIWSPEIKKAGAISKRNYGVTSFKFGMPGALFIDRRHIMVTYWAVENKRSGINCSILALE